MTRLMTAVAIVSTLGLTAATYAGPGGAFGRNAGGPTARVAAKQVSQEQAQQAYALTGERESKRNEIRRVMTWGQRHAGHTVRSAAR